MCVCVIPNPSEVCSKMEDCEDCASLCFSQINFGWMVLLVILWIGSKK